MSSFLRTIQRTAKMVRDRDGNLKLESRRLHFNGRGAKLGTHNPKDPARYRGFKKKPKAWRSPKNVERTAKPKATAAQPLAPRLTRTDRRQAHGAAMDERRAKYHRLVKQLRQR